MGVSIQPAVSEATQTTIDSQTLDLGTGHPADRPVSGFVNVLKTRVELLFSPVPASALNFVRSDKEPKLHPVVCYHTTTATPPQSRISQSSTVVVQRLQSTHQRCLWCC